MQKYRPKTPVAAFGDRLLRAGVACTAGLAWFIYLWDVSLPALTAGLSLGVLLWLCARQFGKTSTAKREKQLRRIIGGELALKRLLLMQPRRAAFQAALWAAPTIPLVLQQANDWEVTGLLDGKRTALRLIAQHESQPVTVQQVVECARSMQAKQMEQCILCLTAPVTKEARAFADEAEPPIHIISREEMIDLAGICQPATDEDLQRLAQRRRQKRTAAEWRKIILSPARTKRYLWYGTGLGLLAFLTGEAFYPLPALACLVLFVISRLQSFVSDSHRRSSAQSTPPPKAPRREP